MPSEIDILKERGLPKLPKGGPAPPEATAASDHYYFAVQNFERLIAKIESYRGQAHTINVGSEVQKLITEAFHLVLEVREKAKELAKWPEIFIRTSAGEAIAYRAIAGAADEAYQRRLSQLEELETALGSSYPSSRITKGTLLSHEGYPQGAKDKGHLLTKHVALSIEDFKKRILEEGQGVVSAFIDRPTAEDSVWRAVELQRSKIDRAREGAPVWLSFKESKDIGYVKVRGGTFRFTNCGRLLIIKDSNHPSGLGFRIVTVMLGKQ